MAKIVGGVIAIAVSVIVYAVYPLEELLVGGQCDRNNPGPHDLGVRGYWTASGGVRRTSRSRHRHVHTRSAHDRGSHDQCKALIRCDLAKGMVCD